MSNQPWWRHAVIYQVYPRSWADADGDGIGDLPGITSRLEHLADLGVDALWLSPFYVSPQNDAGYDVADFRDVDPLFGTLDDFDALVERAHGLGLRVIVDVVPNHSSSEHPWFQAALAAGPGSPERARYVFRPGKGTDGAEPPNNWTSNFGGPAWTRVTEADGTPGEWYLHLFDVTQPDFDWTNPEVREELLSVLRFWLDRGVDGFRIDVAHGLIKADGLPDADLLLDTVGSHTRLLPMWDQPGVHDVYRSWRTLVEGYAGSLADLWGQDDDRMLCGEAWVEPAHALAQYVRPDELHQTFNFSFLLTPWDAPALRDAIGRSLESAADVGAPQTWVLSNHDVVRHATRLGRSDATRVVDTEGIGPDDEQPDAELGLRRARAATTLMLALPGSAYLYQGEELGLPDATELPTDVLQDPTWELSGHERRGRDGCRVPVPWESTGPSLGFGPEGEPWLPQPPAYADLAPARQRGVEGSTLELYRTLLRLRRELELGTRSLAWIEDGDDHGVEHVDGLLSFALVASGGDVVATVHANVSSVPVPRPPGELLVSSGEVADDHLPADTTVWLRPHPA
ncbi:glycoside hydrolase family 13 protein [Cytobacillus oceanisediminis]